MSFYLVTNKHNPVHVREQFSGSIASYAPRNGRASPRFARERFSSTSAPDRRDWLGSGPGGWPPTEQQYVRDERGKRRVLAARSGRPSRTWERGKCAGGGPRCAGAARRAVRPEGSEAVLCVSAVRVQGELSLFPFWRLVFSKDVRYRRCTQKKKKNSTPSFFCRHRCLALPPPLHPKNRSSRSASRSQWPAHRASRQSHRFHLAMRFRTRATTTQ